MKWHLLRRRKKVLRVAVQMLLINERNSFERIAAPWTDKNGDVRIQCQLVILIFQTFGGMASN